MTTTHRAIVAIGAKVALGATLVFTPHTHIANATPLEDQPGWSCVDDGNHVCGPDNSNGAPAGCYDVGGVLVAAWPCHIVVNPNGSSDAYSDVIPQAGHCYTATWAEINCPIRGGN